VNNVDDSSNKCDIDTAEAQDVISNTESLLEQFKDAMSLNDKNESKEKLPVRQPLKRKTTMEEPKLTNLQSEQLF